VGEHGGRGGWLIMDEMEEVHGAGTARLQDDRLVLTLMYHQGDDYTFEAARRSEVSRWASRFPCQSHFYIGAYIASPAPEHTPPFPAFAGRHRSVRCCHRDEM
jgi:hypothetical protein